MIVSKEQAPPVGDMGGSIDAWERGVDPWHADAFPSELKAAGTTGPRAEGWYALDWCGNVIGFIADGTNIPDNPHYRTTVEITEVMLKGTW